MDEPIPVDELLVTVRLKKMLLLSYWFVFLLPINFRHKKKAASPVRGLRRGA